MTLYLSKYISMQPAGIVRNSHLRFQISIEYLIVYYKSSRNKLDLIWKSDYIISWIILQLPNRKKNKPESNRFSLRKKNPFITTYMGTMILLLFQIVNFGHTQRIDS